MEVTKVARKNLQDKLLEYDGLRRFGWNTFLLKQPSSRSVNVIIF